MHTDSRLPRRDSYLWSSEIGEILRLFPAAIQNTEVTHFRILYSRRKHILFKSETLTGISEQGVAE